MKQFLVIAIILQYSYLAHADETMWFSESAFVDTLSCESGGDITTPTGPYKYGYNFTGWEPASTYDITTLDTTENSTSYQYTDTSTPLRTKFSYGTILIMPLCSKTTESEFLANPTSLNTNRDSGGYCYCRVIGFIPNNETDIFIPTQSSWIYLTTYYYNMTDRCIAACPRDCANYTGSKPDIRSKLYGTTENQ